MSRPGQQLTQELAWERHERRRIWVDGAAFDFGAGDAFKGTKDGALVGITIATGMPKHMDVDAKRHPGGNQWLASDLQNEKGGGAICTSPLHEPSDARDDRLSYATTTPLCAVCSVLSCIKFARNT
jgi:hypothetical protein